MANYDIAEHWEDFSAGKKALLINLASDEKLEKWASDPDCNQQLLCATALGKRVDEGNGLRPEPTQRLAKKGVAPFDPRTEVSSDAYFIAGRIVKHLWIIFVALPFVLAVLFVILRS